MNMSVLPLVPLGGHPVYDNVHMLIYCVGVCAIVCVYTLFRSVCALPLVLLGRHPVYRNVQVNVYCVDYCVYVHIV